MKGLKASLTYSCWSLRVEEVNVVRHLNFQSCVEKYQLQSITNIKYTSPSTYSSVLPLGKKSMSIAGRYTNKYTNSSYLGGLPLIGKKTMFIVSGHTNKYANPSYMAGLPLIGKMTMSIVGGHK